MAKDFVMLTTEGKVTSVAGEDVLAKLQTDAGWQYGNSPISAKRMEIYVEGDIQLEINGRNVWLLSGSELETNDSVHSVKTVDADVTYYMAFTF